MTLTFNEVISKRNFHSPPHVKSLQISVDLEMSTLIQCTMWGNHEKNTWLAVQPDTGMASNVTWSVDKILA